ncbi:MAG: RluA family pseudouridine synthase [Paludibacteraceae bacterium]|nr:RluA family pseudouridine synthase [Paludibacteraceae bacterium]
MPRNIPKTRKTTLSVKEDASLMDFLISKMGGMTRNSVKLMLSHRQVSVNGAVETRFDLQLHEGDEVVVTTGVVARELVHPKLKIIYEDDDLIVVEKKPGLLTVATHPDSNEVTCLSILKNYVKQKNARSNIYTVHRLDRETSGLLVFVKSYELQQYMRDYWRDLVTKRTYVAVAEGSFEQKEGKVQSWLTEDDRTCMVYSSLVDDGGKLAVTNYKVLQEKTLKPRRPDGEAKTYSLVELNLETGRKNQIRVHLTSLGHPVIGDRKYGSSEDVPIDRLALHARVLEFIHPVTEKVVHFETVIPREFALIFK